MKSRQLIDGDEMNAIIRRMADELIAAAEGTSLAFVGIRSRGAPLAERLARVVGAVAAVPPPLAALDITLYRDDFSEKSDWPEVKESSLDFPVEDKTIVLVDDVLFTGRTIRAAINALMDYGRPQAVKLAVLIDRGHRELPIRPDFVGRSIDTAKSDRIRVHLKEIDGSDEVLLESKEGTAYA